MNKPYTVYRHAIHIVFFLSNQSILHAFKPPFEIFHIISITGIAGTFTYIIHDNVMQYCIKNIL